ncbi:MAG: ferredoxin [Phycisphaeraceae bacterium]|nr:ferredoxin [Phycisphaeraceae bacterium]
MPSLTIDGQEVSFDGQPMILQVALDHGLEIPHYCYHPGLSVVASCRICLVEIAAPNPRNENKVELIPKLMPACQTPAADGMVVQSSSPKAVANQKAVMEYLLINHPIDCPVCDQAGECHLQDYSYKHGRGASRFQEDKVKQPKKDIGEHVLLYADRCIMCTRCVRFTREVSGTSEIGVFGRGHTEQIDVFPGRPLENELSGNVVDICPVGALLDKDFLFEQRVWFLGQTASIDPLTASGDSIWIHHNEGRIYRVKPRPNPEVNQWWISDEIRYGWHFVHSEDRLTTPRRMQFGEQIEAGWDRAGAQVEEGLREAAESGPGSLAVMVSPMLTCEEAYLLGRLVRGLDAEAVLVIGPVPVEGEDRTFPGGYRVHAEKCPNRHGVQRALSTLGGEVIDYAAFLERLSDKKSAIKAAVVSGNYPAAWPDGDLVKALGKRFLVVIDTLANDLCAKADVLLPSVTWAEKSGTFENAANRIQAFEQAIDPIESARSEGRIATELLAQCGLSEPTAFDPQAVRREMGGVYLEIEPPPTAPQREGDMQYVAL